jgi:positive regulator of sigma E activity
VEENGIVTAAADGSATVRMTASPACDGCGQASLCHPGTGTERTLQVRDPLGTHPGDTVRVLLPGRGVWAAVGLVYVWPLAMLLVGAWAGYALGAGGEGAELTSALGAVLGLVAAFAALKALRPWYEHRALFRPVVTAVLARTGREVPGEPAAGPLR